jgi:hypothetical protein
MGSGGSGGAVHGQKEAAATNGERGRWRGQRDWWGGRRAADELGQLAIKARRAGCLGFVQVVRGGGVLETSSTAAAVARERRR